MLESLHFIRPYWMLAFLPLAWLYFYLLRAQTASEQWKKICDPQLLPHLLKENKNRAVRLPIYLFTLGMSIAIIALSGPSWSKQRMPLYQLHYPTVIILDVSNAMLAADIKPDRMTRAKYKIIDLLKALQAGEVGMLVFSSEPFTVSPLTTDSNTIINMIPDISTTVVPIQGSNTEKALKAARQLLAQSGYQRGNIVLVTSQALSSNALAEIRALNSEQIATSIMGIGTDDGAPIPTQNGFVENEKGDVVLSKRDRTTLENAATAGGGIYVDFSDNDDDIQALNHWIASRSEHNAAMQKTDANVDRWQDEGGFLAWLLLPLGFFAFRRGWFS